MLRRCRGKPFYIWDKAVHNEKDRTHRGDCCFTDIIGRPRKNGNGNRNPFFDYQKMLYWGLFRPGYLNSGALDTNVVLHPFKEKHLWVKKSTGLGVSEFFLRLMAWLCVCNDDCKNSQMVIVTGPNIDLSIKLIKRMKKLFQDKLDVTFDSKETVLELNGCSIEAYPSNHIDSFRSLTNPKFIFIDEGDFMPKFQQEEVRAVSERYIAKSDPFIVMVSTPNAPG
jgi:late competence protein required for DNA uptake (superfamily II DNA/RNA helicase)